MRHADGSHLRARFNGRTAAGRKIYILRNTHLADMFSARARSCGYRNEQLYLSLGRIEVQILTDAENRREYLREETANLIAGGCDPDRADAIAHGYNDRDLGTY